MAFASACICIFEWLIIVLLARACKTSDFEVNWPGTLFVLISLVVMISQGYSSDQTVMVAIHLSSGALISKTEVFDCNGIKSVIVRAVTGSHCSQRGALPSPNLFRRLSRFASSCIKGAFNRTIVDMCGP